MGKAGDIAFVGKETGKAIVRTSGKAIKTVAFVAVAGAALGLGLGAVGGGSSWCHTQKAF